MEPSCPRMPWINNRQSYRHDRIYVSTGSSGCAGFYYKSKGSQAPCIACRNQAAAIATQHQCEASRNMPITLCRTARAGESSNARTCCLRLLLTHHRCSESCGPSHTAVATGPIALRDPVEAACEQQHDLVEKFSRRVQEVLG